MYDMKFNKLWDLFENVHMGLVRENKMLNEECAALREQLGHSENAVERIVKDW
jgi:regulator of replication initiation timing